MGLLSSEIKSTGRWGEEQAVRFLRRHGYRILERNYSCRFGEIDVIASRRGVLSFIEVKTRRDDSHGEAREFVSAAKQQRLLSTASLYLSEHETELQPRFDVIEVYAPQGPETRFPRIVLIENAFS